jgi:hypothetical protein
MTKKGSELIFINRIDKKGEILKPVPKPYLFKNAKFELYRLSINYDTYIAIGFNSFVVKLK